MSNSYNDAHKVCESKIHNICKTGKAVLLSAETINAIEVKCHLHIVAHCVIIASVRSYTEKLLE
jgi:hypothetical protein